MDYQTDGTETQNKSLRLPIHNSRYHPPWHGLPLELRVMLLNFCLNVPEEGVKFYGDIWFSTYDEDTNDDSDDSGCSTIINGTLEWSGQQINTTVVRLSQETMAITLPMLYGTLRFNAGPTTNMKFLRWLPEHLRHLVKHIVFNEAAANKDIDLHRHLASFIIKALNLELISMPMNEQDNNDHSVSVYSYCVVLGRLPGLHLYYERSTIPDEGSLARLRDDRDELCGPLDLDMMMFLDGLESDGFTEAKRNNVLDAHRRMYPFQFTLAHQGNYAVVTAYADPDTAEVKIKAASENQKRDIDYAEVACGRKIPNFEKRISWLQEKFKKFRENIEEAARKRMKYQRHQEKKYKQAGMSRKFMALL